MADEFKVNDQSAAVAEMAVNWPIIRALVGGTKTMRAAGQTYLPKWPQEEPESYNSRLNGTVLFNAFGRTTRTLASKPFARQMRVDDVSDSVKSYLPNIDAKGTDVHAFGEQIMRANLRYGLHGVLVEAPKRPNARTRQDEIDAGVRPYLTHYNCDSILGWRAGKDTKGNSFLTQLRLAETVTEPDGKWGEKLVPQVRVIEPGKWEVWREKKLKNGKLEWMLHESGTFSLKKVPFVFFYGIKEGFGIGAPPLLDLAHLNVQHWQSSSDQDNILHVARVPILFAKGFTTTDTLVIGAKSACSSISPEAELKWVEHTGQAIGSGRQAILDLEDRMRQIGAELVVKRPSAQTATAVSSDDESNRSDMQNICEQFEDSMELCLNLMGEFEGATFESEVKVHKDFKSAQLGEKAGDFLHRSVESGHISLETGFEHAQRADLLAPEINWTDERKRIEGELELRKKLAEASDVVKPAPKAAD